MSTKILGSVWFTSRRGCVGIVLIKTPIEEKAYIGVGHGISKKADEKFIADWGTSFPLKQAKELI